MKKTGSKKTNTLGRRPGRKPSEKVYVSLDEGLARLSKMDMLSAQADLVKIQKHIRNFQILAKQKEEIKQQLGILVGKLYEEIERFGSYFPEVKIDLPKIPLPQEYNPEEKKKKKSRKKKGKKKGKKTTKKKSRKKKHTHHDLDEELKKIKEQLEKINAS